MPSNPRIQISREKALRVLAGHPVQLQTPVGLLELEQGGVESWTPMQDVGVSSAVVEMHSRMLLEPPDAIWIGNGYQVFVKTDTISELTHLSIKRDDRMPITSWRHCQQMKNEICGDEREGIQLFPRESRLADNANQFHLWVLPAGMTLPIGFENGMVLLDDEIVEAFNNNGDSGRQEPLQPGLTLGRTMREADAKISPEDDLRRKRILEGALKP